MRTVLIDTGAYSELLRGSAEVVGILARANVV